MVTTVPRRQSARFNTPGGNTTTPVASSRIGATQVLVVHQAQQPGGTNPMHAKSSETVVVVLVGTVDVVTATETFSLAEGDAALISPQLVHRLSNTGDVPAEWLVITPANVEFSTPTGERIEPIWARHHEGEGQNLSMRRRDGRVG